MNAREGVAKVALPPLAAKLLGIAAALEHPNPLNDDPAFLIRTGELLVQANREHGDPLPSISGEAVLILHAAIAFLEAAAKRDPARVVEFTEQAGLLGELRDAALVVLARAA